MNIAELELEAVADAIEEAGYTVGALRVRQVLREFEKLTLELATKVADHEADKRSLNWCGEQLSACSEYLKEGETVSECISRNRRDADEMLGALAKERIRVEDLERENADLRAKLESAQRDAERYRWLRDKAVHAEPTHAMTVGYRYNFGGFVMGEVMDSAIDAAMSSVAPLVVPEE